jgi:hypothetical protein
VVIGVAKDVTSETRQIAEAYAKRNMVMKMVEFDQNSGEFRRRTSGRFIMPRSPKGEKRPADEVIE